MPLGFFSGLINPLLLRISSNNFFQLRLNNVAHCFHASSGTFHFLIEYFANVTLLDGLHGLVEYRCNLKESLQMLWGGAPKRDQRALAESLLSPLPLLESDPMFQTFNILNGDVVISDCQCDVLGLCLEVKIRLDVFEPVEQYLQIG